MLGLDEYEYESRRELAHGLFTPNKGPDPLGTWVDLGIMLLIIINVAAVVLQTVDAVAAATGELFFYLELVSVAVFTIEYLARLWAAGEHKQIKSSLFAEPVEGPLSQRVAFASRPLMILDLLAIMPFYLTVIGVGGVDLRFLRALRLVRLFRLLKLVRYSKAISSLTNAVYRRREKLVITLLLNVLLLVVASSAMYYVEHPHQPDVFSSIPATFYWGVVTLTTVGYGDVTPVTAVGQGLAGLFAVLGIGLFALPASILADGFEAQAEDSSDRTHTSTNADEPRENAEQHTQTTEQWQYCPHCGKQLADNSTDASPHDY
ncbi:MAG: Kef-type K+ transport system, putative NAD-binding component [halophilic archaeon J07HX5]|jgi:Ion transport protein.|nr:MAG: Kef-type K+ transport system, putative NAD-binding component [halophilic archaeon J07HX5]